MAVVTIPTLVKNHNEHAWSTAKDVFSKRLDVAMKTMNTDGTLTGYATTAEFVKALKKNIKINQVCTDDVTKCFAKILGPQNGGYTYLTNADCTQAKTDGKIDVDYCFGNTDYYAGAVLACGGKKANLPSPQQLALLGTELYNYNVGTDDWIAKRPPSNGYLVDNYTIIPYFSLKNTEKAQVFLAAEPTNYDCVYIWSNANESSSRTKTREYCPGVTRPYNYLRNVSAALAVCVSE